MPQTTMLVEFQTDMIEDERSEIDNSSEDSDRRGPWSRFQSFPLGKDPAEP